MTADQKTFQVRVRGRVQGVGYRAWVDGEARRLGLTGTVRNRTDGSVEAVFCGPGAAVDAMIALCRKGPRAASVTSIETFEVSGRYSGFEILPTS